jgi:CubicO group peptidase (beta-lactamase class C family)
MNSPKAWSAGFPALGGIGTASALAKFYQAILGHIESPLSPAIRHALTTPLNSGDDRVLLRPTVFSCGAQLDPLDADGQKIRKIFGPSPHAFGHPGAGGSHALADPDSGISFAYVMNQMNLGVMPGPKCMALVEALFRNDG